MTTRTDMASYAARVVATPEFFWRVIERKLGRIPNKLVNKVNKSGNNTFAFWKGLHFRMSSNQIGGFKLFFENSIDPFSSDQTLNNNIQILYSMAEISSSIDPEKEAHEEFKRKKFFPV